MLHQRFDSLIIIYQQIIFRLSLVTPFLNPLKSISSLKCDETRGWKSSNTEIPRNIEVGMKEVEGNVSFFAVLSSDWPGVVICWSPRCRRPEVGPWLFVQRRWLPTRAIWNDGGLWKMNSFLSLFLLVVQTANVLLSC